MISPHAWAPPPHNTTKRAHLYASHPPRAHASHRLLERGNGLPPPQHKGVGLVPQGGVVDALALGRGVCVGGGTC